jgi:hypothetical protein
VAATSSRIDFDECPCRRRPCAALTGRRRKIVVVDVASVRLIQQDGLGTIDHGRRLVSQLDVCGVEVKLAARLCTLAEPGEGVVWAAVRDELVSGLDGGIDDMGDCDLGHVAQPVRVYKVLPPGSAAVRRRAGVGRCC